MLRPIICCAQLLCGATIVRAAEGVHAASLLLVAGWCSCCGHSAAAHQASAVTKKKGADIIPLVSCVCWFLCLSSHFV